MDIRVFLEKNEILIFYRAILSFGVFGENVTYKILSILMHIYGVLPTVEISCVKSMGFGDCYKYVPFLSNLSHKSDQ